MNTGVSGGEQRENMLENYFNKIRTSGYVCGLKTGFELIDKTVGGLQKFVVLAGKPGSGKTTLATQLALGAARINKIPVLFYSLEMHTDDILTLIMQNLSSKRLTRDDIYAIFDRPGDPVKNIAISDSIVRFNEFKDQFYIIDSSKGVPSPSSIQAEIEKIKLAHNCKDVIVVIDSFNDLVTANKQPTTTAAEEEVAHQLEVIQIQTGATIIATAQKMSDTIKGSTEEGVKGSISIYHKPTTVLELISYKEILAAIDNQTYSGAKREKMDIEAALIDPEVATPTVLFVSKHRNGINSRHYLKFYGAYRHFEAGFEPRFENQNEFRVYSYLDL